MKKTILSNIKLTALFDSGNTMLHFALWDGRSLIEPTSVCYPSKVVELKETINSLLNGKKVNSAAICSVSVKWKEQLLTVLNEIFGEKVHIFNQVSDTGLSVEYENPSKMGIDRILAAHSAYRYFGEACVVAGLGTAATVDAVKSNGTIVGCFIFPGMNTMAWSLSSRTSLPEVLIERITPETGNDTESCIRGAISVGFYSALKSLIIKASDRVGGTGNIILTGGESELVKLFGCSDFQYRKNLVLEGLGYMCK